MNKEKLNELRSKVNIPLAEAIALLKQYDENLELCIKVFHQKNIEKICTATGLDEVQVQKIYKEPSNLYNVDRIILGIEKKLDTLNSLPMRITIEENPDYIKKIGFFISVENEQLEEIYNVHDQVYFIPEFEFSHVIDIFRSVYPVLNPITNMKDEYFDACSYNYFNRDVMKEIIIKIKNMKTNDVKVKSFLTRLIVILEEKMEIGYYTVIEGNQ